MLKMFVLGLLLAMLAALFNGLRFLVAGHAGDSRLARALTWRIALAVTVFLVLMGAFRFGFIGVYSQ